MDIKSVSKATKANSASVETNSATVATKDDGTGNSVVPEGTMTEDDGMVEMTGGHLHYYNSNCVIIVSEVFVDACFRCSLCSCGSTGSCHRHSALISGWQQDPAPQLVYRHQMCGP